MSEALSEGQSSRLRALFEDRLAPTRSVPRVAIPMANNPEVVGAVGHALKSSTARFVLVGPKDEILREADGAGVDLSQETFVEEHDPVAACDRAAEFAARGEAHVLMKGLVQTSDFVKAVLNRDLGLVPSEGLISHVTLCDVPGFDRLFLLTDAAITTYPNVEQKCRVIENALSCAVAIGMPRPKVALVAPVEKVSAKIPSTTDAVAVRQRYETDGRLDIDGPFGLDVALRSDAAAMKGIAGSVAGKANIIVTPNIDAGNVLYKALTGFTRTHPAGIVAGASVPIVLTSRADSEESKINSLAFALVAASSALP